MSINFISIRDTKNSNYEVVLASFPKRQGMNISLSVSKNSIDIQKDKETAEVAARKIADLNKYSYVHENTSVITSIPFGGRGFLAMELTANGEVIGQGSVLGKLESIAEASVLDKK